MIRLFTPVFGSYENNVEVQYPSPHYNNQNPKVSGYIICGFINTYSLGNMGRNKYNSDQQQYFWY